MSDADNIKNFSAEDINRYHQGLLSPQERHAIEKAALEDPFLSDALEGYATVATGPADLTALREKLQARMAGGKVIPLNRHIPWLRIAAILLVMAGAGIPAYVFLFKQKDQPIAQEKNSATAPAPANNDQAASGDTPVYHAASGTNTLNKQQVTSTTDQGLAAEKPASDLSVPAVQQPPAAPVLSSDTSKYYTNKEFATPEKTTLIGSGNKPAEVKTDEIVVSGYATAKRSDKQERPAPGTITFNTDSLQYKQNRNNVKLMAADKNRMDNAVMYTFNNFRGRVTDNNNNPLPFANIVNLEDNVGTYSDARGFFNLTSPDTVLKVQVKSIGFNISNTELKNTLVSNQITLQDDKTLNALVLNTKKVNAGLHARNNNQQLTEPEPTDGWDNYDTYIANNLNVPDEYQKQKSSGGGEVEISFEVDKNGVPVNFKVERSLCSSCDKEAIRLIKEGPKWIRKAKNGRTTVKISF